MSRAATGGGGSEGCRYKGVRRRRWGKWVSEIRVPGTRERLWLGSYATPEAAALAHDAASYLLRGGGSTRLNFPERAAEAYGPRRGDLQLSPQSVQRVASDAGMAADAQLVAARESVPAPRRAEVGISNGNGTGIAQGGASARQEESYGTYWCTYEGGGRNSGSCSSSELAANGELSVDDMEIWM